MKLSSCAPIIALLPTPAEPQLFHMDKFSGTKTQRSPPSVLAPLTVSLTIIDTRTFCRSYGCWLSERHGRCARKPTGHWLLFRGMDLSMQSLKFNNPPQRIFALVLLFLTSCFRGSTCSRQEMADLMIAIPELGQVPVCAVRRFLILHEDRSSSTSYLPSQP